MILQFSVMVITMAKICVAYQFFSQMLKFLLPLLPFLATGLMCQDGTKTKKLRLHYSDSVVSQSDGECSIMKELFKLPQLSPLTPTIDPTVILSQDIEEVMKDQNDKAVIKVAGLQMVRNNLTSIEERFSEIIKNGIDLTDPGGHKKLPSWRRNWRLLSLKV